MLQAGYLFRLTDTLRLSSRFRQGLHYFNSSIPFPEVALQELYDDYTKTLSSQTSKDSSSTIVYADPYALACYHAAFKFPSPSSVSPQSTLLKEDGKRLQFVCGPTIENYVWFKLYTLYVDQSFPTTAPHSTHVNLSFDAIVDLMVRCGNYDQLIGQRNGSTRIQKVIFCRFIRILISFLFSCMFIIIDYIFFAYSVDSCMTSFLNPSPLN